MRKKTLALSIVFMGLAHLTVLKQRVKGVLFAAIEVGFLACLPFITEKISGLITLGTPKPDLPITMRDNSMFMMIDGIIALAVVGVFAAGYWLSVKSALADEHRIEINGKIS
jgi:arabinogalactan oligomer/maltooligosaccharide transport system permease protein